MTRTPIGRTVRRLRTDRGLSQQALASQLGISASYLNLIEHDQRAVTASLLIKLAERLGVELHDLSGRTERALESGLREAFADPLLSAEAVPESELTQLAAEMPNATRAILSLYRAWRVAREDAGAIALPTGRKILLPTEEARDFFNDASNHFPVLEAEAEQIGTALAASPHEMNHAIAERLRHKHGIAVTVGPLPAALRHFDPTARTLLLSEALPRESRGFQMAFQLALLEARDAVESVIARTAPSSPEAAMLIRIGLLNYIAAAISDALRAVPLRRAGFTARCGVACRALWRVLRTSLSTIVIIAAAGTARRPFFFLRVDPAGNVSKRFSAAGFPFARYGGSCPRWVVHTAFARPNEVQVQLAELPDGTAFLCFARTVRGPALHYGEPRPTHVVAMGCSIEAAPLVVYADGLDIAHGRVGIGLSCRLCDRPNCRSRAFPPLEHRLALDPMLTGVSPWRFEKRN